MKSDITLLGSRLHDKDKEIAALKKKLAGC